MLAWLPSFANIGLLENHVQRGNLGSKVLQENIAAFTMAQPSPHLLMLLLLLQSSFHIGLYLQHLHKHVLSLGERSDEIIYNSLL